MFLTTQLFRFLDIINYVGPGVSYEAWTKAHGCQAKKSWFPYDWFDSPEKLDFPGLPEHKEWYSSLKGEYILPYDELEQCKSLFQKGGLKIG